VSSTELGRLNFYVYPPGDQGFIHATYEAWAENTTNVPICAMIFDADLNPRPDITDEYSTKVNVSVGGEVQIARRNRVPKKAGFLTVGSTCEAAGTTPNFRK